MNMPNVAGTAMVTLADARNASAKPGSVGGDLLVLLSGVAYAVRMHAHIVSAAGTGAAFVLFCVRHRESSVCCSNCLGGSAVACKHR